MRYPLLEDPVAGAMLSGQAVAVVPIGTVPVAAVIGVIALIFGGGFGSTFAVVMTISLYVAALCALVAVGLLVYRITVFPGLERQSKQRSEQAVAAWRQRRLDHVTEWEQRLGWPAA
ncbi:MAG: hypothetical protein ACRDQX_08860 [Pseudonocardiaceae bacterium]